MRLILVGIILASGSAAAQGMDSSIHAQCASVAIIGEASGECIAVAGFGSAEGGTAIVGFGSADGGTAVAVVGKATGYHTGVAGYGCAEGHQTVDRCSTGRG